MSLSICLFFTNISISQLGIGTTNSTKVSMLDLTNKGILNTRIPLTGTDDIITMGSSANRYSLLEKKENDSASEKITLFRNNKQQKV